MREFSELLNTALAEPLPNLFPISFTLENGGPELDRWFADVTLERYPDSLVVTEPEPIVAYARSMSWFQFGRTPDAPAVLGRLQAAAERSIAVHGAVRITSDTGLFSATRP